MHSFDGRVSDHLTDSSLLADVATGFTEEASTQMHDAVRPLLQVEEIDSWPEHLVGTLIPVLEETGGQKIYLDAYQKCPLDWLTGLK